jgi:hypothetical protein
MAENSMKLYQICIPALFLSHPGFILGGERGFWVVIVIQDFGAQFLHESLGSSKNENRVFPIGIVAA